MAEHTEWTELEALDFALADVHGNMIQLADYRGRCHVVLVFNRGFV